MTIRELFLLISAGMIAVFVSMLYVSMAAYFKRSRHLKRMDSKVRRALPIHVLLMAAAFLISKVLTFATTWHDAVYPTRQFPFIVRLPWEMTSTVLAIIALHYLLTYERRS